MPIGAQANDFIVNSTSFSTQQDPVVTVFSDGRFSVAWHSYDLGDGSDQCVRLRLFNSDGSPAGADQILNSTVSGSQRRPSLAAFGDGRFVATWISGDNGDGSGNCVRARIIDAAGNGIGNDFVVNTTVAGNQDTPRVTLLSDGRFVVLWDSHSGEANGVRARIFASSGTPIGNDFVIDSTAAGSKGFPSITALAGGGFVATWESADFAGDGSSGCVRGRVFTSNGAPTGDDFLVNSTAAGYQFAPTIAALPGGGFVATWASRDTGDGNLGCIRARVFGADGMPIGADFIVNSSVQGTPDTPTIVLLADGRFVIAWADVPVNDGTIRARLFLADGTPAGADFVVETTTAGYQTEPSVASMADGRFVVTWKSQDAGDGSDSCVRARVFDPRLFIGTESGESYIGGALADDISGAGGNDTLSGGLGDDMLQGGSGDDNISGDGGADFMAGGAGDDRFVVDTYAGESVAENPGEGTDVVYATIDYSVGPNIEQIILVEGSAAVNAGGADDANVIIGNSANNVIYGYGGDDVLSGGGGADSLLGQDGNDAIDGQAGNDQMIGGLGNDSFVIDSISDAAAEFAGQGIDTVYARIDYTLGGNIEQLILVEGTAATNGAGDGNDNTLIGNSAANLLYGNDGADTLYGFANNDTMVGGNGADIFDGGTGNDNMSGGAGADQFKFAAGDGLDLVNDFSRAQGDRLIVSTALAVNLAGLIAAGTTVGGNAVFSFAGGTQTITLTGVAHNSLTAADVVFF